MIQATEQPYIDCRLCPRHCRVDRRDAVGFCGQTDAPRIARAALHLWEEPCISGKNGSGAVFFTGCNLGCVFCQNYQLSGENFGETINTSRLAAVFLALQEQGAHNLNLVTATPHLPAVLAALDCVRGKLHIPVVYNTSGYETVETLRMLDGYVDIYLPDFKYMDSARAGRYSGAADYPEVAQTAIAEMVRQTEAVCLDKNGMMQRGVLVRHLVLPGGRHDSAAVMHALGQHYAKEQIFVSVMSQYTPFYKAALFPELNRRVTTFEYESVCDIVRSYGFSGYFQQRCAAKAAYTPSFDLTGVRESGNS